MMNTLFEYSCLDITVKDELTVCGFSINLGNEWDDLEYCYLRRNGSVERSVRLKLNKGWYKKFKDILIRHLEIKQVSSWIYKKCEHLTEHKFQVEVNGWNREFGIYCLGVFDGHLNEGYKKDELIILEMFRDIQEFFVENGYKLEFCSFEKYGNNGNNDD